MIETVQRSVISVDGIRAIVDRPWQDGEYDLMLTTMTIVARDRAEIDKATLDVMTFGTGVTKITADGIQHVPIEEWLR